MKKITAFIGSLLVISGLKAQADPPIHKETTPPPAVTPPTDNAGKDGGQKEPHNFPNKIELRWKQGGKDDGKQQYDKINLNGPHNKDDGKQQNPKIKLPPEQPKKEGVPGADGKQQGGEKKLADAYLKIDSIPEEDAKKSKTPTSSDTNADKRPVIKTPTTK